MDVKSLSVTVVGLGLMGGSFLKALRPLGLQRLYGVDVDQSVLEAVKKVDLADDADLSPERFLPKTDVLIICLPPQTEVNFICKWQHLLTKGAIITDVCGVKVPMLQELLPVLRDDVGFVPGHPMCGREIGGFARSYHELYLGCNYILTPLENREAGLELVEDLAYAVGSRRIVKTTPQEHDQKIALTSHLPHVLAAALTLSAAETGIDGFTGGSYKDATRVAQMNVSMWSELFLDNKDALLKEIKEFSSHVDAFMRALEDGDREALVELIAQSSEIKEGQQ